MFKPKDNNGETWRAIRTNVLCFLAATGVGVAPTLRAAFQGHVMGVCSALTGSLVPILIFAIPLLVLWIVALSARSSIRLIEALTSALLGLGIAMGFSLWGGANCELIARLARWYS